MRLFLAALMMVGFGFLLLRHSTAQAENQTVSHTSRSPVSYTVSYHNLTAPQQAIVKAALHDWEQATSQTSRPIHFKTLAESEDCIPIVESHVICFWDATQAQIGYLAKQGGLTSNLAGITNRLTNGSSDILVNVSATSAWALPEVWRHEIGHALGLRHTGPNTLMCDGVECASPQITRADVEQYLKVAE